VTGFILTGKQQEAQELLRGAATHIALTGGSRSGKTALLLRAVALRALKASKSRHAILRFRLNHLKASIINDSWPKMLGQCFPQVKVGLDKQDLFATFPNGSQVWFGGLDDKERVEKVLGQEHSTIYLNECSQISFQSRNMAMTRLAQAVNHDVKSHEDEPLPLRMYYDANPPKKSHWLYHLFVRKLKPGTLQTLNNPNDYVTMQMNPIDNLANLPKGYIDTLKDLPVHMRKRFLDGEYGDTAPGALWDEDVFEKWRHMSGELVDMLRIVVAVDPSGASDDEDENNDDIGIVVCGLGTDGNAYVLEDLTLHGSPAKWGNVATTAYDRHSADLIVGEVNYGGTMVEFVVRAASPHVPYKSVTATRGKVVRAQPIAALYEQGKVRHVGNFAKLEDELCAFTETGYQGAKSPNRADALVWAMTELFPGIAQGKSEFKPIKFAGWGG